MTIDLPLVRTGFPSLQCRVDTQARGSDVAAMRVPASLGGYLALPGGEGRPP
jgi:hypothetical protein